MEILGSIFSRKPVGVIEMDIIRPLASEVQGPEGFMNLVAT